jgi:hypothetical protein
VSRIRSIHPGFFTDEAVMSLTIERPLAIALLMGLWVEADDAGIFEWKPLTLKARILPAASDDVGELLSVLAKFDFVKQFGVNGRKFGVIRNFVRFQRPKTPHDTHPFSEEMRLYAGFTSEGNRPSAGTGRPSTSDSSEQLPNSGGTTSEKRAQRKEEGGEKEEEEVNEERARRADSFGRFWERFPNKVARPAAERAFAGHEDEIEAILTGIDRYVANKPPDREWMAPAKFLEERRWEDEPALKNGFRRSGAPLKDPGVFVLHDTPQWAAWCDDCDAKGKPRPNPIDCRGKGTGWFFPTAWPPSHAGAAA